MQTRLLAAIGLASLTAAAPPPAAQPGRLPANVVPMHYDVRIDADAKALAFTGQETVTISVAQPTRRILLNAAELNVGAVRLDGTVAPVSVKTDEAAQTLTIDFAEPVATGTHRLAIGWSGRINRSAAGLFAVDYQDKRGAQRMLVTQMEPADGRRVLPMWDEPAAKATFTLTASAPRGQTAFSNMPAQKVEKGADGGTVTTFQPTPKMSSYLLFLGIGDVERKTRMVGRTEIGVITRRGALDQGDYALDSAARLLSYFNDYFGTPYPLPKLDMIAAPGQSQFFSAMENWGAILYFDRAVLLDPDFTTETGRQRVFTTIAHEMAHQWFGDLVTMRWWDDLWLNEGFAEWMDGHATIALNPSWNYDAQLVAGAARSSQVAMTADAQSSSHPVVQRIATVDQVAQAFDTITYLKGDAVIRMLEGAVGEEAFREGVRRYMARHAYGNTVTEDLWRALSEAAGRPVKPFMDTFTKQAGVPLVTVGAPRCAAGRTTAALSQGRYGLDAASKTPQRWIVPVEATAGGAEATKMISGAKPQPFAVPGCAPVIVNAGRTGYYRVLYGEAHFRTLADGFAGQQLTDQLGLMGDALGLANGGYAPLSRAFDLIGRIPANADPLVWNYAAQQLAALDASLEDGPVRDAFRARAITVLAPAWGLTGFEARKGETPAVSQLRETLILRLGGFGDPRVVQGVRGLVARGIDTIPAAVREPVLTVHLTQATPAEWEAMRKRAAAAKNPAASRSLYERLGLAADPALAERALTLALTDEVAAVPDRASLISGVAAAHPALAFDWAVAHAAEVNGLIETSARPGYIVGLARGGTDPALATRVQAYAAKALPAESRQGAEAAISTIRAAARLKQARGPALAAWAKAG
ncbi:MAG: M1 family metallopeptidase [Sphingomonas fennica]